MAQKSKFRKIVNKTKHTARRIVIKSGAYPNFLKTKLFVNRLRYRHGSYHIGERDYTLGVYPKDSYEKIIETNGEMNLPVYFIFEPTMRCNLTCDFCYQKDSRNLSDKHELTFEQVTTIIDNLGKQIQHIFLIGSEVFMRKDIVEIIEYLDKKGIACSLATNGTLITEQMVERILKCPNVVMIWMSIDGLEELHNKLRGSVTAFKRTTRALKMFSGKMNIGVNTVVMDTNLYQLKELIPLMHELGVPQITFELEMFSNKHDFDNTMKTFGLTIEEMSMLYSERTRPRYDIEELRSEWKEIQRRSKELGVVAEIKPPVSVYNETFYKGMARDDLTLMCRDWQLCRIDCKGNIILCGQLKKKMGNLLEKPLAEIWNSKEFKATRMKFLTHNMSDICKRCEKLCHVPVVSPRSLQGEAPILAQIAQ